MMSMWKNVLCGYPDKCGTVSRPSGLLRLRTVISFLEEMLFSFLYSCEDEGSVLDFGGYSRKYKYKYLNPHLPYVRQFVLVFINRS